MEKRPPWRPTKYKKEFCNSIVTAARAGSTMEMYADSIDVHKDTLYEWAKVHKDFSDAMKRARQAQQIFMQKIGLKGMTGNIKGFGQAAWIFWMKAQFGWTEADVNNDEEQSDLEFLE